MQGLPSFDITFGAIFLGIVVGMILYGLTLYQAYKYYTVYVDDRLSLKAFVAVLIILETLHSGLWIVVGYHFFITEAFNVVGLRDAHWSVRLSVLTTGLTVFICQMFYAHRVYYGGSMHQSLGLRCYRWLAAPAILLITTALSLAIAITVIAFTSVRYISDFKQEFGWLISTSYGFMVLSDFVLTGALVFLLQKSRIGSKRSDTVLVILIKYTFNTGLLTSIFSALVFVFAIILPGNLIYAGISIVGVKLYANSVLAVVNSRESIRNVFRDEVSLSVPSRWRREVPVDAEGSIVWQVRVPTISDATEPVRTAQGASPRPPSAVAEKPYAEPLRRLNVSVTV